MAEDSKPEDRLSFFYRDEALTPKFIGGEWFIRNDYEREQLSPPNKVLEDSEIIFRGPDPLPTLGDAGRMIRLFGLFLDRIVDDRETMLKVYDYYKTDLESIPYLCNYFGIKGLDDEDWNVDKQRRYLRLMRHIHARGGIPRSYLNLARLLGFLTVADTLVARRRWDTVYYNANIDSRIPAVYLDEMGSMDTWHESFPLALLRWRFYKRSARSTTGSLSIPADRLLTDSSATFSTTTSVNSLIVINDPTDTSSNGEYVVTEIHSDTELKVDQDWPVGSLSDLIYTTNWEIPRPDPWADYLLTRFFDIAPDSMRVMHRDEPVINYFVP